MPRVPRYRRHTIRDFAFVEIAGRRRRLPGRYGSAESRRAYHQLLAAHFHGIDPPALDRPACVTVADLAARWVPWAADYYGGNAEYGCCFDALRPLLALHAATSADRFGPQDLAAVRDAMVAGYWQDGQVLISVPRPWSRTYVNHQVHRIRRMFRWGVEQQIVPAAVLAALKALSPLRLGKTPARESAPVRPVAAADVEAVLLLLAPPVRAMVQLQRLTGARSDNLCAMRLADIDRTSDVWGYVPLRHKSAWRDRGLFIPLGPRAQAILGPFLEREPDAYLFSPREAAAWRYGQRRAARRTPMTPSQTARHARSLSRRQRPPGERYTTASYRRAIRYAIRMANRDREEPIATWHPHQLRHNVATVVRKHYGIEASRAFLGHATTAVTEIYAELDADSARQIAREIG